MANILSRESISKVKAEWYLLMVDETNGANIKEPAVICFRIVEDLVAYEFPVGLKEMSGASAHELLVTIKDILLRLNIPIELCRGQSHDGAASMRGKRSGLKTLVLNETHKVLFALLCSQSSAFNIIFC